MRGEARGEGMVVRYVGVVDVEGGEVKAELQRYVSAFLPSFLFLLSCFLRFLYAVMAFPFLAMQLCSLFPFSLYTTPLPLSPCLPVPLSLSLLLYASPPTPTPTLTNTNTNNTSIGSP